MSRCVSTVAEIPFVVQIFGNLGDFGIQDRQVGGNTAFSNDRQWRVLSPWCTLAPKVLASGVTMVYSGSKGAGFWCHHGVLWLQRCWLLVSPWCTLAPKVLASGVTMGYSGSKGAGFSCHHGVLWLQRCWLLVSPWCTLAPKMLAD